MQMQSDNINELMAALAKAQGQIQGASKDKVNPHFKSKYADLASIWDACRESLSKNQLGVTQTAMSDAEGHLILVTTLGHSSGQWMRSYMPILMQRQDAQGMGSALTYTRRFSLAAMVGVAPDDDDGEAAGRSDNSNVKPLYNQKKQHQQPEQEPAKIANKLSKQQLEDIGRVMGEDEEYKRIVKAHYDKLGKTKPTDLTNDDYVAIMKDAEARKKMREAASEEVGEVPF